MVKLTIAMDGVDLKDIVLTKDRTTIGRRPYNDIVIDNLAVSGEHAVFVLRNGKVEIEDLASTNGTYVNGKAVHTAMVTAGDVIEIARYKIRLDMPGGTQAPAPAMHTAPAPPSTSGSPLPPAKIRVLTGNAAGREMPLVKVVTTLGKPGVAVASITHRPHGYTLALVDGQGCTLNGQDIGAAPVALQPQDVIDLAGTQMRFEQED